MTTVYGNDGVVKAAGGLVADVLSFSFNMSGDTVETTTMGITAKTFIPGKTEWDGSVDVLWDPDDAAGQEALVVGASVALILAPENDDTTGDVSYVGNGIITGMSVDAPHDDMVKRSFTFKGTGALTRTVAA